MVFYLGGLGSVHVEFGLYTVVAVGERFENVAVGTFGVNRPSSKSTFGVEVL